MKRIDTSTRAVDLFGSGKDGFKDGNLALGVAPTDLNADWFNQLQEEVANVIEAAAIALDGSTRTQLLAAIRSLVKTAGFHFSGTKVVSSATTLTAADAGKLIQLSGSGPYTVTLPAVSTVPDGSAFYFYCTTGNINVARAGSDTFQGSAQTSYLFNTGDTLTVEAYNLTAWNPAGGSAQLGSSGVFASNIGAGVSGYKKYPDSSSPTGFIIEQWGSVSTSTGGDVTATYSIAFPNAVKQVLTTVTSGGGSQAVCASVGIPTTTSVPVGAYVLSTGARTAQSVYYRAFGY